MPKAIVDGVHRRVGDRQPHRVAAHELHPARRAPAARTFVDAVRQHRAGEVDADDARGAACGRAPRQRDVGRAGAHVQQPLAAGQLQRRESPARRQ